jgi:hypothetical protein
MQRPNFCDIAESARIKPAERPTKPNRFFSARIKPAERAADTSPE